MSGFDPRENGPRRLGRRRARTRRGQERLALRLLRREDQALQIFAAARHGQRQKLRRAAPILRLDWTDAHLRGSPRDGGTKPDESALLQIAEHLGLTALHAEQVGGAGHVDVEKGAAHQEIGGLRRDVFRQLGQALRGDHAGEAALAPAAHQIGHGDEAHAARLVRGVGRGGGSKELRLVHHHQGRKPDVALGLEQGVEKLRGAAQLAVHFQLFQIKHDRDAVAAHSRGDGGEVTLAFGGVQGQMAIMLSQRDEIAFRVDDDLLNKPGALLQQTAQQMRFARTGISLHQQPRREQFLEVDQGRGARAGHANVDRRPHPLHPHIHCRSRR